MSTTTFSVGTNNYACDKLSAFDQLFVVRKLLPIVSAAIPSGIGAGDVKKLLDVDLSKVLPSVTDIVAKLPEEDVQDLLIKLLTPVRRQQEAGWAQMVVNKHIMFNDISTVDLMKIAFNSGKHSLQDFFGALPLQLSKDESQKPSA